MVGVVQGDGNRSSTVEDLTLAALADRVAQLEARLNERGRMIELREREVEVRDAEISRLRSDPVHTDLVHRASPGDPESVTDRRRLLQRAGMAAAGVVAGGTALATATEHAAAANGDPILMGADTNSATASTKLTSDVPQSPGAVAFGIVDRSLGAFPGSASIAGHSNGRFANALFGFHQTGGNGVCGQADGPAGVGVRGFAQQGIGGVLQGGRANMAFLPGGPPPLQRLDAHTEGELVLDGNGDLWMCIEPGTPGKWRYLSGRTPQRMTVLATPVRVYDSRPGFPPLNVPKGPWQPGEERNIVVDPPGLIIPDNSEVFVNVTVTETGPPGWMSIYRPGQPWPGTSTVNWTKTDDTKANLTGVPLLGRLFRTRASEKTHAAMDLIILVTPRIVDSP